LADASCRVKNLFPWQENGKMITWNTQVDAPGCAGEIVNDDGASVLIQTDFDWPGVAMTFGWNMTDVQDKRHGPYEDENGAYRGAEFEPCYHEQTDGTVDCKDCTCKATDFIAAAGAWLADNDGATADDPGYFGND
jgi:hypothetical protein